MGRPRYPPRSLKSSSEHEPPLSFVPVRYGGGKRGCQRAVLTHASRLLLPLPICQNYFVVGAQRPYGLSPSLDTPHGELYTLAVPIQERRVGALPGSARA